MLDELWVVGKVSNHFQGKHRFAPPGSWATSRILNRFSLTSELVSFSSGFKLKTLDYIFKSSAYRGDKWRHCGLVADSMTNSQRLRSRDLLS
jgi:hypothetical protein